MRFRINYNGEYEDSFIIKADTLEKIREIAYTEINKRDWDDRNCWSEKIE